MEGLKIIGKVLLEIFLAFGTLICILGIIYILLVIFLYIIQCLMIGNLMEAITKCIMFFGISMIICIFAGMIF